MSAEAKEKLQVADTALKKVVGEAEKVLVGLMQCHETAQIVTAKQALKTQLAEVRRHSEQAHAALTFGTDLHEKAISSEVVKLQLGAASKDMLILLDTLEVGKTTLKVARTKGF